MPKTRRTRVDEDTPRRGRFTSHAQVATVALLRTTDLVRRRLARVVEPEQVTLQQYNVLRILRGARGEPLSAGEISERLVEQAPGVSRLIDRLVAKGLVRRGHSARDRRVLACSITAQGLELLARLDPAMNRADDEVVGGLSERELVTLNRLLGRIRRSGS